MTGVKNICIYIHGKKVVINVLFDIFVTEIWVSVMVKDLIEEKLKAHFVTELLTVENESHQHNVPAGSESHFKVVLVSDDFKGQNKVKQHQQIYKILAAELAGPIHALALHTYDVDGWTLTQAAPDSPDCLGGSK
jgi:BolA protein